MQKIKVCTRLLATTLFTRLFATLLQHNDNFITHHCHNLVFETNNLVTTFLTILLQGCDKVRIHGIKFNFLYGIYVWVGYGAITKECFEQAYTINHKLCNFSDDLQCLYL